MKLLLPALLILFYSIPSYSNLVVYPIRLVLSQKQSVGKLTLKYNGKTPMKFKIATKYYQQTPNGSLFETNKNSKTIDSAENLLRFSPRFVTLNPGEIQVVRIMARRNGTLSKGEYRAHIHFESMKQSMPSAENSKKGITTNLVINMGVAIPVIYRFGTQAAQSIASNVKVSTNEKDGQRLLFSLKRMSKGSTYNKVIITEKDKLDPVALLKGISTYLDEVSFKFPLSQKLEKNKEYEFHLWDEENDKRVQTLPLNI